MLVRQHVHMTCASNLTCANFCKGFSTIGWDSVNRIIASKSCFCFQYIFPSTCGILPLYYQRILWITQPKVPKSRVSQSQQCWCFEQDGSCCWKRLLASLASILQMPAQLLQVMMTKHVFQKWPDASQGAKSSLPPFGEHCTTESPLSLSRPKPWKCLEYDSHVVANLEITPGTFLESNFKLTQECCQFSERMHFNSCIKIENMVLSRQWWF